MYNAIRKLAFGVNLTDNGQTGENRIVEVLPTRTKPLVRRTLGVR